MDITATDLLLDYNGDPAALDRTLQAMPIPSSLMLIDGIYQRYEGHYVARTFGSPDAFKFFVEHQGYCKVIRQLEVPL
jgi:hypothetical protein